MRRVVLVVVAAVIAACDTSTPTADRSTSPAMTPSASAGPTASPQRDEMQVVAEFEGHLPSSAFPAGSLSYAADAAGAAQLVERHGGEQLDLGEGSYLIVPLPHGSSCPVTVYGVEQRGQRLIVRAGVKSPPGEDPSEGLLCTDDMEGFTVFVVSLRAEPMPLPLRVLLRESSGNAFEATFTGPNGTVELVEV